MASSKREVFQLHISLKNSKPRIWRRVLVPSDFVLSDLHCIIQSAMGWSNVHLHQFVIDGKFYAPKHIDDDFIEPTGKDCGGLRIDCFLKAEGDKIQYDYDFGDGWEHIIKLEAILPFSNMAKYPICVAGKMNCPPEDSGGIYRYRAMLEILKQPDHEEYDNTINWLDGNFNPRHFSIDVVNGLLGQPNFGCR